MKRVLGTVAIVLAVPAIAYGQGTTEEIDVGDDFFQPENVSTNVGEKSYHWAWGIAEGTVNEHNVREQNKLFYSGNTELSGDFTATPSAGTFLYVCDAHGTISSGKVIGMGGKVSVKPTATPQGSKVLVTWATEATDTGSQFDVRQKVGSKDPKVVESKTKAIEGTFKLKNGTNYQFQARSRQGNAVSDWSPKLKVKG